MTPLERLSRENGKEYALRCLRRAIVSLELEPGALLSEQELGQSLGMSRTPVREALLELARVGMVEILPQRGSRVALIDEDLVEEAWFLRSALEGAAVELLCRRGVALTPLAEALEEQRLLAASCRWAAVLEADDAFHRQFFCLTGKLHCYEMIKSMAIHFDRVRSMTLEETTVHRVLEEHTSLLSALERRDETAATALLREHLARFRADLLPQQLLRPQYFRCGKLRSQNIDL